MERNFNKREFEDYIQQNADQYRMFPSEKVWKKIHGTLHTRRKWYGVGLATLLLSTVTAVTWVMFTNPASKKPNIVSALRIEKPQQSANTVSPEEIQQVISFDRPVKPVAKEISQPSLMQPLEEINSETSIKEMTIPAYSPVVRTTDLQYMTDKKQIAPSSAVINKNRFSFPEQHFLLTNDQAIVADEPAAEKMAAAGKKATESPLTIESVTNIFQIKRNNRKVSWQLFFSPTVSYRKLSENDHYQGLSMITPGSYPFSVSPTENINSAVTHKPDLGLEIGLTARYPVTPTVFLRSGIQFNIRRYDIKAFAYRGELANIDLTGPSGPTTAWTYYRTQNGYKADWLKNFYLTVSLPVGAEVKLFGNKNTNVGIAGTLQPTYIISDRAYLISTDYKNYAKVPSLIRHVNLNTSFETFVNYKTGKTQWQVGPQIRYQVLSSFQNKYPVKENLFDFGLKIGITLNNH